MGTTAEKLQAVLNSKNDIKSVLENKGLAPSDVFSTYAGLIEKLVSILPEVKSFNISNGNLPANVVAAATNGSRIVAITSDGTGAYSDNNGQTWTTYTLSYSYSFNHMIYAEGVYVCVADDKMNCIYSTDGETWTTASLKYYGDWRGIAHGNGVFVAVCYDTAKASYSYDGITWKSVSLPADLLWSAVEWCTDRFIAVASGSDTAAYSYDGITWEAFTLPSASAWCGIAAGNGKTIIISGDTESSNVMAWSSDLSTWNSANLPTSYTYKKASYNNGVYILTTNTGNILYSYDGLTWTAENVSAANNLDDIVYMNGTFILIPAATTEQKAVIVTTKMPPADATFLGDAKPEDIPCGVVFTSIHGIGLVGKKVPEKVNYVLTNAAGTDKATLTVVKEEKVVI